MNSQVMPAQIPLLPGTRKAPGTLGPGDNTKSVMEISR